MKIRFKETFIGLAVFFLIGIFFFYKSISNTKGLIINHIFKLNINQANIFYIVVGCVFIFISIFSFIAVFKLYKRLKNIK